MGIGSHISERRLIDELTRMGMNESIVRKINAFDFKKLVNNKCQISNNFSMTGLCVLQVRRALLIMHQREEVEYKRERRVIVRKA